jgi:hypothetical protein
MAPTDAAPQHGENKRECTKLPRNPILLAAERKSAGLLVRGFGWRGAKSLRRCEWPTFYGMTSEADNIFRSCIFLH